jgi:photosystem II stability/assembly factor-like uncharacterized protein
MRYAWLLIVLLSAISPHARAASTRIEAAQRISEQDGWVTSEDRVFRTSDSGRIWKDVSPQKPSGGEFSSSFFLSASSGWVLTAAYDEATDTHRLSIAATTDGGVTWTTSRVAPQGLRPEMLLAGATSIYFADALHGWIDASMVTSSAAHGGIVFATQDGGKSWSLQWVGSGGEIRFSSLKDGWLVSPEWDELWSTNDGGETWQQPTLPAVNGHPSENASYSLPIFADAMHAYLPVVFSGAEGSPSTLVLFQSADAGRSWRPGPTLDDFDDVPTAIFSSSSGFLAPRIVHDKAQLILFSPDAAPAGKVESDLSNIGDLSPLFSASFVNRSHGWILTNGRPCGSPDCSYLLSTEDGGHTWGDITPGELRKTRLPVASPTKATQSDPQ